MLKLLSGLAVAGILVINSASVNATLIDNGNFTSDTVSGLDWLDMSSTLLSGSITDGTALYQTYDYVSSQFGLGGEFEGWRSASGLEVSELLLNASQPINVAMGVNTTITGPGFSAVDEIVGLLGPTRSYSFGIDLLAGLVSDSPALGRQYIAQLNSGIASGATDLVRINMQDGPTSFQTNTIGAFLVRNSSVVDVPEPASLSLLGLGLLGLAATRRQKKS